MRYLLDLMYGLYGTAYTITTVFTVYNTCISGLYVNMSTFNVSATDRNKLYGQCQAQSFESTAKFGIQFVSTMW